jgi:hypothetical protein
MTSTCRRCKGTGCLPQFAHVAGGRCVACQGSGVRNVLTAAERAAAADELATFAAASQAAWDAEVAARRARIAARAARRAAAEASA